MKSLGRRSFAETDPSAMKQVYGGATWAVSHAVANHPLPYAMEAELGLRLRHPGSLREGRMKKLIRPLRYALFKKLGEWKIDAERSGVSGGSRTAEAQNGCASLGVVDGVSRVRYRVTAMTRIRRDRGIKVVDERLVEEQLRRIRAAVRRGVVV